MNIFASALVLALAVSTVSAGLSSSADENARASSSSAVVVEPHEVLVKILNGVRVDISGSELKVDVEDELHTAVASHESKDSGIVAPVEFGGLRATIGNSCFGSGHDGNPKKYSSKRNGNRYSFNIFAENAECRDAHNMGYEWGEYIKISDATKCADACVTKPDASVVKGGKFRGFQFACPAQQCRCLYDAGTLITKTMTASYDRAKTNQGGVGSIVKKSTKSGYYCAKLVGAATLEVAVE